MSSRQLRAPSSDDPLTVRAAPLVAPSSVSRHRRAPSAVYARSTLVLYLFRDFRLVVDPCRSSETSNLILETGYIRKLMYLSPYAFDDYHD